MSLENKSTIFGGISADHKATLSEVLKNRAEATQSVKPDNDGLVALTGADDAEGAVLYSDGGARPNPGYPGYGVHGYLYRTKQDKKSAGHPTHFPTRLGYMLKNDVRASKDEDMKEVDALGYIDIVTSMPGKQTNNVAELVGAAAALETINQFDIKRVLIYMDSKYVHDGINKYIDRWIKCRWRKPDGSEFANQDEWLRLKKAKDALEARGVEVIIEWMYGHTGNVGNEAADTLATVGVMKAKDNLIETHIDYSQPDQYWKIDTDRHPLLTSRALYYVNKEALNIPGTYYVGAHGKDDDALSTRITEGMFAVVELEEPSGVIEAVRTRSIEAGKLIQRTEDTFMLGNLDAMHRPITHEAFTKHGKYALAIGGSRTNVTSSATKEALASELIPCRNAFKSLGSLEEIDTIFRNYLPISSTISDCLDKEDLETANQLLGSSMPGFAITDLTGILYETVEKGKGKNVTKALQLKAEYTVGFAVLPTNLNYRGDNNVVSEAEVRLMLGLDLPNRNALKRLEELNPRVVVLSWVEPDAPLVFRYCTIIQANGCRAIWSGHYSNYRFLGELKKAKDTK